LRPVRLFPFSFSALYCDAVQYTVQCLGVASVCTVYSVTFFFCDHRVKYDERANLYLRVYDLRKQRGQ